MFIPTCAYAKKICNVAVATMLLLLLSPSQAFVTKPVTKPISIPPTIETIVVSRPFAYPRTKHENSRSTVIRLVKNLQKGESVETLLAEKMAKSLSSKAQDLNFVDPFSSVGSNNDDATDLLSSPNRLSSVLFQAKTVLGPASRLAQSVDDATDGWALSYADLSPETETTPVGQAFLATNIAYAVAGIALSVQGDLFYGALLELVSMASFLYHYTQLQEPGGQLEDGTVKAALLIDYCLALTSIFVGLVYIALDHQLPPLEGLISGGLAVVFLLACWIWEHGLTYIVLHSIWHILSAYTGFIVGTSHQIGT